MPFQKDVPVGAVMIGSAVFLKRFNQICDDYIVKHACSKEEMETVGSLKRYALHREANVLYHTKKGD